MNLDSYYNIKNQRKEKKKKEAAGKVEEHGG